jgi:hypothetical protein
MDFPTKRSRKVAASTIRGTAELVSKVDRPVEELKNIIGTQPLKMREQELRSIMQDELGKTLQQLKTAKDRLSG